MKIICTAIIAFVTGSLSAQEPIDKKAKAILDELSVKTKAYTSIKAEFTIVLESKDKKKDSQNGTILLKGEKYKLEIKGQDIICDGKTSWTYLKDANEVQVNNVDNKNEELNPANIFTLYEKGYKYKFEKEETIAGATIQTISLFPTISPDKKKFHTVKLMIDKTKKQISSVKMLMKDGSTVIYNIKTFTPNTEIKDNTFAFDKAAHPGVEIVDLRD